jgi:hypothetical protein
MGLCPPYRASIELSSMSSASLFFALQALSWRQPPPARLPHHTGALPNQRLPPGNILTVTAADIRTVGFTGQV